MNSKFTDNNIQIINIKNKSQIKMGVLIQTPYYHHA